MATLPHAVDQQESTALRQMLDVPVAFWVDSKRKIRGPTSHTVDTVEGVLRNASLSGRPLCVFILYNLPNRDCNAKASSGEICCERTTLGMCDRSGGGGSGTCDSGLREYRDEFITPIAELLRQYAEVPTAWIIEPDSLGNLVTNVLDDGSTKCDRATARGYREGIRMAVRTLAEAAPSSGLYLDAGHGGWLGYETNANKFAALISELGVAPYIRGFSTNVANYQPLGLDALCPTEAFASTGSMMHGDGESWLGGVSQWCQQPAGRAYRNGGKGCCSFDPCRVLSEGNGGATEMSFVQTLQRHFLNTMNWKPRFVIDTGRNGVEHARSSCSSWCNIRGAGAGHVATIATGLPDVVDAFFWLKTPGESGTPSLASPRMICSYKNHSGSSCLIQRLRVGSYCFRWVHAQATGRRWRSESRGRLPTIRSGLRRRRLYWRPIRRAKSSGGWGMVRVSGTDACSQLQTVP